MSTSNLDTGSENIICFLNDYVQIKNAGSIRIVFHGVKLLSVKEIFMNFKGRHAQFQKGTERQSKTRHAAERIAFKFKIKKYCKLKI